MRLTSDLSLRVDPDNPEDVRIVNLRSSRPDETPRDRHVPVDRHLSGGGMYETSVVKLDSIAAAELYAQAIEDSGADVRVRAAHDEMTGKAFAVRTDLSKWRDDAPEVQVDDRTGMSDSIEQAPSSKLLEELRSRGVCVNAIETRDAERIYNDMVGWQKPPEIDNVDDRAAMDVFSQKARDIEEAMDRTGREVFKQALRDANVEFDDGSRVDFGGVPDVKSAPFDSAPQTPIRDLRKGDRIVAMMDREAENLLLCECGARRRDGTMNLWVENGAYNLRFDPTKDEARIVDLPGRPKCDLTVCFTNLPALGLSGDYNQVLSKAREMLREEAEAKPSPVGP